ncbi:hypothetical protein EAH87_14135 [Sphingomonas koreensis]|nr:hypothetical protein EAH87_14135 [Sphingomonas koreensis]
MDLKRGPSRDPFEALMGLINGGTPFADVLTSQLRAERVWPSAATAPILHALAVQESVMHRIEGICVFRPSNLVGVDYIPPDLDKQRLGRLAHQSQIRKRDGVWEIEIPFGDFKNHENSDLFGTPTHRVDYFRRLEDEAGLNDLLDYFFLDQRNMLRLARGNLAAFVTSRSPRMSESTWSTDCRDWSARNVAWNEVAGTGFKDVLPFSPYAYRHIVGCDTLLNSDSPESERPREAARRLQTSERMIIGHYGFLLPEFSFEAGNATYSKSVQAALSRVA